jgi:spore germination protein GerM
MQNQQPVRRIPISIIVGISAAILAAGGGGAWLASRNLTFTKTSHLETTSPSPKSVQPATEQKIEVYWLNELNGKIELVPTSIKLVNTNNPSEVLETAFNSLLTGPTDKAVTTTIPKNTKLRNISVKSDGIHIDLSQDFSSGGGSTSMTGRLAQILYTATSLEPAAKVWINVEGKPLETLGGEGIVIDQPMTRKDFEENFEF